MSARSRKRRRRGRGPGGGGTGRQGGPAGGGTSGRQGAATGGGTGRQAGAGGPLPGPSPVAPTDADPAVVRPTPPAASPPSRSRSEERNAAVRATLTPLAEGERPWPLKIAVVLAVLIAVGNVVQALVGNKVKVGTQTGAGGPIVFGALMLVCAAGMWRQRYWAVLGFQALLAIIVIIFAFVLLTANDFLRGLIAIAVIGAGGTLFFKLVRVLGRLQMPRPGGPG